MRFNPARTAGTQGDWQLLLLHGFGGSSEVFEPFVADLPSHLGVWSTDLFGHGRTGWPGPNSAFDDLADDLNRAARMVPEPRYLVGYSLGARLGLATWNAHPDLFRGASLVGVHPGLRDAERSARQALDDERRARLLELGKRRFFDEWDQSPLFSDRTEDVPGRRRHDTSSLARALSDLSLARQPNLRSFVSRTVRARTLQLVVGEKDEKFRRLLAEWEPRVLPGSHDVVTRAPAHLARAVYEHLGSLASPG